MQRTDLLIAFLAFGAAVSSLMAWMWATVGSSAGVSRVSTTAAGRPLSGASAPPDRHRQ